MLEKKQTVPSQLRQELMMFLYGEEGEVEEELKLN